MILAIILTTLAVAPDLCGDVLTDDDGTPYTDVLGQTLSRYCEWTGPDAPRLDAEVCCDIDGDDAQCDLPDDIGRCATGSDRYSCEFGEATADGVTCYQPFPDACDFGFCLEYVGEPPVEAKGAELLCCTSQGCETITVDVSVACSESGGYLVACSGGATNEDGTVDCLEDE